MISQIFIRFFQSVRDGDTKSKLVAGAKAVVVFTIIKIDYCRLTRLLISRVHHVIIIFVRKILWLCLCEKEPLFCGGGGN